MKLKWDEGRGRGRGHAEPAEPRQASAGRSETDRPPHGVRVKRTGRSVRVIVSTRSCVALFLLPFTAVWAGGSMMGIYGQQIIDGEFNLMLSLFGIPFLIGSIVLVSITAMSMFGRLEVMVADDRLTTFYGVGPLRLLGWRRVFPIGKIANMKPVDVALNLADPTADPASTALRAIGAKAGIELKLEDRPSVTFARAIKPDQRDFLFNVIADELDPYRRDD